MLPEPGIYERLLRADQKRERRILIAELTVLSLIAAVVVIVMKGL